MIVTKAFIDRYDDHHYFVGDSFPHEASVVEKFKPERLNFLLDGGYIESPINKEIDLTKDEIKALLDERGIEYKSNASKDELIALMDSEG